MAKGMLLICCYATVLATCFAFRKPDTSSVSGLYTRNVQITDVTRFQGAVLLVDGKQTSCESVVLDSRAGLVAASCLKYGSDKGVDKSIKYEIVMKSGNESTASNRYTISSFDVHPNYNPDTYINNLAVVQFNTNDNSSWINSIATNPKEWNNEFFIRRSLSDVSSMTWNKILAYSSTETPDYCQKASKVYSANTGDFLCNYAATLSIQNSKCKVPYGVVFAAVQPSDVNMVALYSHSAVYGDSMCSKDRKLHYYTLLRNYIGWVAVVLGRSVGTFAKAPEFKFTPSISYSMKNVEESNIKGVKVFSGDSYSQNPVSPDVNTPQSDDSIDEKEMPLATTPNTDGIPLPTDTIKSDKQENKPTEENAKDDDADDIFLDDTSSSTKKTNTESIENTHSKTIDEDAETSDRSSEDSTEEEDKSAETSNEADKGSNTNKIVVIVMLAIGGIALVGAVIAWFLIRRKKHAARRQNGWNRESMDQLPRGLRPTVDYTDSRSPTQEIINHYSTRHSGYGANPMRDTYNSDARRDTYNDRATHGAYNRGTRRDTFEDGARRDTYDDGARQDTYDNGAGRGTYNDAGRRDTYDDSAGRGAYGDGGRRDTYDDGGRRDTYDDGGRRDTYDDGGRQNTYGDDIKRDNHGGAARRDTYDDRAGHTTYENSNFQWRLNSTYNNQR